MCEFVKLLDSKAVGKTKALAKRSNFLFAKHLKFACQAMTVRPCFKHCLSNIFCLRQGKMFLNFFKTLCNSFSLFLLV